MNRITIIGLHAGDPEAISAAMRHHIYGAELLVGGKRHLAQFPDYRGETLAITNNIETILDQLTSAREAGSRCVVLASGDPLFYGMGGTLRRRFPPEALEIFPAPASFQLAFAAVGESWQDARLLSAHGRPLPPVISQARQAKKVAILTDSKCTPALIAQELIEQGVDPISRCVVCENLGRDDQRVKELMLQDCPDSFFGPLNVFLIWPLLLDPYPRSGIPDHLYQTEKQQITKREIRLLTLGELQLGPQEVLWDIGAGSGAVSIEAGRSQPSAQVFAVEKRPIFCDHIRRNLAHMPAPNVDLFEGEAPSACHTWPTPQAIFIGGSGGKLAEIITLSKERLADGGRLVLNLATLENLNIARKHLPSAKISQIQVGRGRPIQEMIRFEALNPIFMVTWTKRTGEF